MAFIGVESQDYLRLYNANHNPVELKNRVALSRNITNELHIETDDRIKWRFTNGI